MSTAIRKCTCGNDYQDIRYGDGMRVMNSTNKTIEDFVVYRCTVCEKESHGKQKGEKR